MDNGGALLLTILLMAVSLYFMLHPTPGKFIQSDKLGWVAVRGVAFTWSLIMALGTYSHWYSFGQTLRALLSEFDSSTPGDNSNIPTHKITLLSWCACWLVVVQIIAIFYIADWCKFGL